MDDKIGRRTGVDAGRVDADDRDAALLDQVTCRLFSERREVEVGRIARRVVAEVASAVGPSRASSSRRSTVLARKCAEREAGDQAEIDRLHGKPPAGIVAAWPDQHREWVAIPAGAPIPHLCAFASLLSRRVLPHNDVIGCHPSMR